MRAPHRYRQEPEKEEANMKGYKLEAHAEEWYKGPGEERPIALTDNLIIPPDGDGPDDDGPDGGQPEPEADDSNSPDGVNDSPEGPGEEPDIDAGSVYEARAELGARTGMPAWYDAIA